MWKRIVVIVLLLLCCVGCGKPEKSDNELLAELYGDHFAFEDGEPLLYHRPGEDEWKKIVVPLRGVDDSQIRDDPAFQINEIEWDDEDSFWIIHWQVTNTSDHMEAFETATVEIKINDNWYVMYSAAAETAEMKYIGAGETKHWSTILRNGYYPEKPVPKGKYRLVREIDTDWSAGVTYYAVAEFEIE